MGPAWLCLLAQSALLSRLLHVLPKLAGKRALCSGLYPFCRAFVCGFSCRLSRRACHWYRSLTLAPAGLLHYAQHGSLLCASPFSTSHPASARRLCYTAGNCQVIVHHTCLRRILHTSCQQTWCALHTIW